MNAAGWQGAAQTLGTLLLYAVLAYGAVVGLLYLFQRHLIYHPSSQVSTPAAAGLADMRAVAAETPDGLRPVSWYRAPPGDGRVVVYFQGNAGATADRRDKVRPFLAHGFGVLLVGYRGYGGNAGTPTEAGLYADGEAALGFLKQQGIPPGHWIFYGESLGSGVAVELAKRRAEAGTPIGAMVLEAPFTSLVEMGQGLYPFVPVAWLLRDRYESVAKIGRVQAPLLVVHGTDDRTVPIRFGERLFAAAAGPKRFLRLERAGHNDLHERGALPGILEFFGARPEAFPK